MSKQGEHRRVSLTTISNRTSFNSHEAAAASAMPSIFSRFGDPEALPSSKSSGKSVKTVRLQLELFESNSNRYPEFNFAKMVYLEKKKAKMLKAKTNNGRGDPFADNDDDVARIAKELEAKYGNAYTRGRSRSKKNDLCDIGMGYDESDSFIDNTDAYDEILPEECETLERGFYINSGALEFNNPIKKSHTRRTDAIIKMPERSRKRVVSSSSSESESSDSSESSADTIVGNEPEATDKNAKSNKTKNNNGVENDEEDDEDDEDDDDDDDDDEDSDSDSESIEGSDSDTESADDAESGTSASNSAKCKQKDSGKSPKPSAAIKQKSIKKKPQHKKLTIPSSSSSNSPHPHIIDISDSDTTAQSSAQAQAQAVKKVVKTTTIKDMLKAKRDSFLKSQGQIDGAVKAPVNGELKCLTSVNVESSSEDDTDSASEHGRHDKQSKDKDKDNNNDNLRTADTLLPAALDKDILLNINNLKDMASTRNVTGKRLFLDTNLAEQLLKIYDALLCTNRSMRNMVFAHLEYQLQLPKYFILRKAKMLRAREEKKKTAQALERLRKAVAEVMPKAIANYEIELHKYAELAATDFNSDHPPKMPRKKFQWTNELRERLFEVYQARWTSFAVLGGTKVPFEQFINGYLKDKVVDLWAVGWMRAEELQREIDWQKNANKKQKEKAKKSVTSSAASSPARTTTAATAAIPAPSPTPSTTATANNYLKQYDEVTVPENSRSRANSDTDSATSASSNSLKRKSSLPANGNAIDAAGQPKPSVKPPKIKFHKQLAATLAQINQGAATASMDNLPNNHYLKQLDDITVTTQSKADTDSSNSLKRKMDKITPGAGAANSSKATKKTKRQQASPLPLVVDTMMTQPSTSAHAAALNAVVAAAAASMLELATPTQQAAAAADPNNIYNLMSAAATLNSVANTTTTTTSAAPPMLNALHSTTGTRPVPHIINLDEYKSPSDILQTSQQLAANKWPKSSPTVPLPVVRCESSSESDGVEIIGEIVPPATLPVANKPNPKSRSKANARSKATSVINSTGGAGAASGAVAGAVLNGMNGALGFNLENMYIYNNNNNTAGGKLSAASVIRSAGAATGFDLSSNPHILRKLSELSAQEKPIQWSPLPTNQAPATGNNSGSTASGTTTSHLQHQ